MREIDYSAWHASALTTPRTAVALCCLLHIVLAFCDEPPGRLNQRHPISQDTQGMILLVQALAAVEAPFVCTLSHMWRQMRARIS